MTALIVVICIAFFLFAVAFLRYGAEAEYSEDGFTVILHIGPAALQIMPQKKKKKKKSGEKKKQSKKTQDTEEKKPAEKKGGSIELVMEALPVVKQTLGGLRHKLLINDLTVYYMAASSDPFKAAMNFGKSSAGVGIILPLLENTFRIRRRDIRTAVSFDTAKPYIYLHARFSISVWETFYVVWGLAVFVIKNFILNDNRKAVKKNGETSNRRPDGNDNAENP